VVLRVGLLTLAATIVAVVLAVATATNSVPSSNLSSAVQPTGANELKPPQCAALNLTNVVTGDGAVVNGTTGNDLILGGPSNNKLNGKGGTDCILGGGGDDDLRGGSGADVCIGGPGTDTFSNCSTTIQ
jgi:Ca2+-binding RTX toxin-like protein